MRDRRALSELDDSKKRSPDEREELYPAVIRAAQPRLGDRPLRAGASTRAGFT